MDKDFDEEISDSSVEASDEDVMPAYSGAIRPYMFEPTMTPDEAVWDFSDESQVRIQWTAARWYLHMVRGLIYWC